MEWAPWNSPTWPGGSGYYCAYSNKTLVPAVETSYMCRGFAMPKGNLWALDVEPIVDRSDVLHHMLAFVTYVDVTNLPAQGHTDLGGGVWDCLSGFGTVLGPMYVWAVGGGSAVYPAGTGYRVGWPTAEASLSPTTNGVPFLMIQYHYSNTNLVTGIRDSSGVRMRVTDVAQPMDVGMVWLGANVPGGISIPSGKNAFGFSTSVSSLFTVPASTINPLASSYTVFGSFLHAHLTGTRIWTEQIRNGQRIKVNGLDGLGGTNAYNFEHQEITPINTVMNPGDGVKVKCVFRNTVEYGLRVGNAVSAAGQTVVGGEATTDEMCMVFLWYWPRAVAIAQLKQATAFCDDAQSGGLPTCASQT